MKGTHGTRKMEQQVVSRNLSQTKRTGNHNPILKCNKCKKNVQKKYIQQLHQNLPTNEQLKSFKAVFLSKKPPGVGWVFGWVYPPKPKRNHSQGNLWTCSTSIFQSVWYQFCGWYGWLYLAVVLISMRFIWAWMADDMIPWNRKKERPQKLRMMSCRLHKLKGTFCFRDILSWKLKRKLWHSYKNDTHSQTSVTKLSSDAFFQKISKDWDDPSCTETWWLSRSKVFPKAFSNYPL